MHLGMTASDFYRKWDFSHLRNRFDRTGTAPLAAGSFLYRAAAGCRRKSGQDAAVKRIADRYERFLPFLDRI